MHLLKLHTQYPKKITRIEGYDISNIQGTSATGSMVVFSHKGPSKKDYRVFHIKSLQTPNDVGMMQEILERRFKSNHTDPQSPDYWKLPNVILIDGGITQFSAAQSVLSKHFEQIDSQTFGHTFKNNTRHTILLLSLAKKLELIYTNRTQLPTPLTSFPPESQQLLKAVRDESHRFALKNHKKLRGKKSAKLQS